MKRRFSSKENKVIQWSIIVCSLIVVVLSFVGDKGLLQLIGLKRQESELVREIQELKQEREDWIYKLDSIKSERSYIETIAREKLGMVRNDEIVYELESLSGDTGGSK